MGGGLMQLVAYGAQDIYLTGNPQITFFKVVYRRHTNFAMECIEQTLQGGAATGGTSTVTISRNGDLVYKVYVTDSAGSATASSEWLSEVELEIGGQKIDKHYKEWMNVWTELSTSESKAVGLKAMQGDIGLKSAAGVGTGVILSQIPLQFWFCRNPGLALPLIALQYHEVKLKLKWGTFTTAISPKVVCDYIYLDTDERRRFAQVSHEYLIEQLQKQTYTNAAGSHKLNFNHPVKELVWTSPATNAYLTAQLKLNGHDRFSAQQEEYFQLRQPFDHHTAVPRQNLPQEAQLTSNMLSVNTTNINTVGALTTEANVSDNADVTSGKFLIADIASFAVGQPVFAAFDAGTGAAGAGGVALVASQGIFVLTADVREESLIAGRVYKITFSGGDAGTKLVETEIFTTLLAKFTGSNQSGLTIGTASLCLIFDKMFRRKTDATAAADVIISKIQVMDSLQATLGQARTSQMTPKINVYSFGLKPEEHQPSGTCNFSRIDNAQLVLGAAPGASAGNIYAVNYNVLRIMSGMGGLAYSN